MDFVLNYYLKTLMTKQALDNYKNICGKPYKSHDFFSIF
jgi:hypothetical protein